MELNIKRKEIKGADGFEKIHQTIKQKDIGHVAYILSEKLYSDPILAVVREYVCNATDAHSEAGKTKTPVNIHAPTHIEQYFSVRDFGDGITFEEMVNMYIHLGDSSKRDSNSAMGCFGIGNMAFRSYTDGMTVTSWCEGEKSIYSLQVGEDNKVFAIVLGKTPMKEGETNGVEIKIPVKKTDVDFFRRKIQDFAKFMQVTPDTSVEIEEEESFLKADDGSWSVVGLDIGDSYYRGSVSSYVIMGDVTYKIKTDLPQLNNESCLKDGVMIRVNMGDVSITPDREKLEYNPSTIRFLKRRSAEVKIEIQEKVTQILSEEKNFFEFAVKAKTFGNLGSVTLGKLKFKGKYVTDHNLKPIYDANHKIIFPLSDKRVSRTWNGDKAKVFSGEGRPSIEIDKDLLIVKNDVKSSGINLRIRTMFKEKGYSRFCVVDVTDPLFKQWSDLYHLDTWGERVVNASDFKKIQTCRVRSSAGSRISVSTFKLNHAKVNSGGSGGESKLWEDAKDSDIDPDEIKYYLPIKRFKVQKGDKGISLVHDFCYDSQRALKILFPVVFGVRTTDAKKLDSTWVNLLDDMDKNYKKYLLNTEAVSERTDCKLQDNLHDWNELKIKNSGLDAENKFPSLMKIIKDLTFSKKKYMHDFKFSSVDRLYWDFQMSQRVGDAQKAIEESVKSHKITLYKKFFDEECPLLRVLLNHKFHDYRREELTSAELRDITLYMQSKETKAKEIVA